MKYFWHYEPGGDWSARPIASSVRSALASAVGASFKPHHPSASARPAWRGAGATATASTTRAATAGRLATPVTISLRPFQHSWFLGQCIALRRYCENTGLRPLVMVGSREIFNIYCNGNQNPAMHGRPVNDNRPAYPPKCTT